MGRFSARSENTRLKQMHPHWQRHRAGPEANSPSTKMEALLDATSPDQLAMQVSSQSSILLTAFLEQNQWMIFNEATDTKVFACADKQEPLSCSVLLLVRLCLWPTVSVQVQFQSSVLLSGSDVLPWFWFVCVFGQQYLCSDKDARPKFWHVCHQTLT